MSSPRPANHLVHFSFEYRNAGRVFPGVHRMMLFRRQERALGLRTETTEAV